MSPVTWPQLYAASAAMNVPAGLEMQLQEVWWVKNTIFANFYCCCFVCQFLFGKVKEEPCRQTMSIPLKKKENTLNLQTNKQTYIATYGINRPRRRFSEKSVKMNQQKQKKKIIFYQSHVTCAGECLLEDCPPHTGRRRASL